VCHVNFKRTIDRVTGLCLSMTQTALGNVFPQLRSVGNVHVSKFKAVSQNRQEHVIRMVGVSWQARLSDWPVLRL
jgi:hypothetical protein